MQEEDVGLGPIAPLGRYYHLLHDGICPSCTIDDSIIM
jgi:hypothetical protein